MAIVEGDRNGFSETIQVKEGADAVSLTTATVRTEVFLSMEEALKKKKAEHNVIKAVGLQGLGVVGIIYGSDLLTASGFEFPNTKFNIAELISGAVVFGAGVVALHWSVYMLDKASLVSRQLKAIKSVMRKNSSPQQNPR